MSVIEASTVQQIIDMVVPVAITAGLGYIFKELIKLFPQAAAVLTATRMPFAMAEDGYLPEVLARKHARYGTPWLAILVSAAIYVLLAWQSLAELISVYIWLRSATTMTVPARSGSFIASCASANTTRRKITARRIFSPRFGSGQANHYR